jgi:hypothetical protein
MGVNALIIGASSRDVEYCAMGVNAPIIGASLWPSMIAIAPTVRAGYAPTVAGIAFDLILFAIY